MTKEEKIGRVFLSCRLVGSCDNCPADHIMPNKLECNFEHFDEELLDKYLDAFGNVDCKIPFGKKQGSNDPVHPNHYKLPGGMEVIDVELALFGKEMVKNHCICTAAEYILRHKGKNGDEDIKKAYWWLSKYLVLTEGE